MTQPLQLQLRGWNGCDSNPSLIIAEVGRAHDGSLGTAHAFVDAAADAGAGAIKFQTHIASAESTAEEPWCVRCSPQDENPVRLLAQNGVLRGSVAPPC